MRESVGGVVAILQVLGYKTEEQGRRGKVRDLLLHFNQRAKTCNV